MEEDGTILVIVGKDSNRNFLVEQILQPLGYHTTFAITGKAGLEQALMSEPDLVIIGEYLPDFSSLELLSIFRQSSCASPILLVTENPSHEHLIETFRQGICDYLLLPAPAQEVQGTIQRVLKLAQEKMAREKLNKQLLLTEAIHITLSTLSHYLNNYLTALGGDLTLLQESLLADKNCASLAGIAKDGQTNLERIQLVTEVLFNTTSVTFTNYDQSMQIIDIENAILHEFNLKAKKKSGNGE
jgi:Response regulator containing CheY-like receiver, AAA-type ATPase, and DNA-binding domains